VIHHRGCARCIDLSAEGHAAESELGEWDRRGRHDVRLRQGDFFSAEKRSGAN
jgi:hypothetical protein